MIEAGRLSNPVRSARLSYSTHMIPRPCQPVDLVDKPACRPGSGGRPFALRTWPEVCDLRNHRAL